MNYERIYSDFIVDRLTKQPVKPAYFEKHHIVPRSLGGGNEKSNLIRLTPEDHYFAHLLLAQTHGGHLWSCVLLLSRARRWDATWLSVTGKSRYGYGLARRMHGEKERGKAGMKGAANGHHNPEKFNWTNLDTGMLEDKTLNEMWVCYGGSRGTWTAVVSGVRRSHHGWARVGAGNRIRGLKGKTLNFVNRDGREFSGTQSAFCKMVGLSVATASRVSRGSSVTQCGWRLAGVEDRSHTSTKLSGKPARLGAGKSHSFTLNGVTVAGKVTELAAHFGSTKAQVHAGISQIKTGKMHGYKGWKYSGIEA